MNQIVNPFIFEKIDEQGMVLPTITPFLNESYAQRYEDIIVMSLLDAYSLKVKSPKKFGYVEIGANHPVSTSSTYLLRHKFNCNGILVEPNHELAEQLRKYRPGDIIIEYAVVPDDMTVKIEILISEENELSSTDYRFVNNFKKKGKSFVKRIVDTISINRILDLAKDNYDIYSLFIDVEGPDSDILNAIDYTKHRPITIQIEASEAIIPGNTQRIRDIMQRNGYVLIAHTYINFIFIDGERL